MRTRTLEEYDDSMKIFFVTFSIFLIFSFSVPVYAFEYEQTREQALANQQAYLSMQSALRNKTIANAQSALESNSQWDALHHGQSIPSGDVAVAQVQPTWLDHGCSIWISGRGCVYYDVGQSAQPQQSNTEQPVHSQTTTAVPSSATSNHVTNVNYWSWIVAWMVLTAIIVITIVIVAGTKRETPIYLPSTPTITTRDRTTFETDVRQSDGTTQRVTTETPLDDNLLYLIKTEYPRDYLRILNWISKHPEDVKIIVKNSEDYRNKIREMAQRAREEQDWSDMK